MAVTGVCKCTSVADSLQRGETNALYFLLTSSPLPKPAIYVILSLLISISRSPLLHAASLHNLSAIIQRAVTDS